MLPEFEFLLLKFHSYLNAVIPKTEKKINKQPKNKEFW